MWKAEIDYCKQIEMPETKDEGGRESVCVYEFLRVYKKANSPIFNSDSLLPGAHTKTHLLSLFSVTH